MAKEFKYITIANAICTDICKGLQLGDRLPTTKEICSLYDVSEITIKKALTFLAERGIVKRAPRRGTILCKKIDTKSFLVKKNVTILNVLSIQDWKFAKAIQQIAEDYNKENPEIKLNFIEKHEANYRATVVKGNFDLILANTLTMREFITDEELKDKFQPIDKLKNFEVDPEKYFNNILKWCRNAEGLMALPLTFSTIMTFVNKQYPGLDVDGMAHDMTFDEFRDFLTTHQPELDAEFPYPFYIFYSWNRWPIVLKSFGGSLFSDDGKRCLLDSEETIEALSYLREIIFKRKLCFPFAMVQDARSINGAYDLFRFQSFLCTWGSFAMTQKQYAKNVMITHLPYAKKRTTHLQLACLLVGKNTENQNVISDFLNYTQLEKNQKFLCDSTEGFSCHKDIGTAFIEEKAKTIDGIGRFIESLEYAEPLHKNARFEDISFIQESLYPMWVGMQPIKETCIATAAAVNDRIKARQQK
jgi:DNA-binding transcriptional regulator YhcF (GntR family)